MVITNTEPALCTSAPTTGPMMPVMAKMMATKLSVRENVRFSLMTVKIIGLIVGLLVLGAGLYYLVKEKKDPESRKIYGVVSAVGGVLVIGCILSLIL